MMTGYRAFSRQFVKTFPVLSKGFEIETEMSIHAVDKNMLVENVIIDYRDRPDGSKSKLNTYSDGARVLKTIMGLYKNYKPMQFFGLLALILAIIAVAMFAPVFTSYLKMCIRDSLESKRLCKENVLWISLTIVQFHRNKPVQ